MDIRRLCYELYKIDWEHSRMITVERKMDSLKNYYMELEDKEYTYEQYLESTGYNGELYVCYEEFCEVEYREKTYMYELLANNELIKQYCADIEDNN